MFENANVIAEWSFWISLGMLMYVYFGYFSLATLLTKIIGKPVKKEALETLPSVSMIVCAYNEEKHILKKVTNCLELDYPKEKVEIIIISDGSDDQTNDLLRQIESPFVRFHIMPKRTGKAECQNVAVSIAKHEVIFFTDATTMHPPDSLKTLIGNLSDPTVGCVTGRPIFNRNKGLTSEGLGRREKYELNLRLKLSALHSLFGAQDCMYVVPRDLYQPVRKDLDSGFVGPLKILQTGYRTVYEPSALAYVDRPVPSRQDEFIRRSRIVLRGIRGLLHMRKLMNPFRYGFLAISLISTRLLRWLTPIFLLIMLVSNILLLDSQFYLGVFYFQVGFYLTAALALILEKRSFPGKGSLSIPLYFCLISMSAAVGIARFLSGDTGQMWQTRR